MKTIIWKKFVLVVTSVSVLGVGLAQASFAGVITTEQQISHEYRQNAISRIEAALLREDVAEQLVNQGVQPEMVMARIQNLTTTELIALDGQIDENTAGGSAIGVIGTVFLVLIILELVGITDIFKSV